MSKTYKVGIYPRLSREDGDNLESESITNQRELIMNYICKNSDLVYVDDYTDDGYSGGNFILCIKWTENCSQVGKD